MKLILFNLIGMVRRYKTSLILNIIGLSIAFASFIVIMMQVMYDLRYDKFHSNADRLYRVEAKMVDEYTEFLSAPLGSKIINSSPDIEMGCWYNQSGSFGYHTEELDAERAIYSKVLSVDSAFFKMFDFETVSGDLSKVDYLQNIVISEKVALRYFNTVDAAGKVLFSYDNTPVTVVGVFKDFPDNTFLKHSEIIKLNNPKSRALQNYNDWNYPFFIMIHEGVDPQKLKSDIIKKLEEDNILDGRKHDEEYMHLTPIGDLHFNTTIQVDSFEKANYATTITLLSLAIIILLIASINFVNFATALVPQRIRSINTQKVLGSTVAALRTSLIIEALVITIISFGISLLIVYFAGSTTFPSLISAGMNISENWLLISSLGGVALLTGLIAGIYPAYYTTSFAPGLILKGSFGLSPRGRKLRASLIGFQFIISFILVIAAIFIRVQNDFMKNHDVGFNRENVLNVVVPNDVARRPLAFREKLMQNPNIKGLAFGSGPIISNGKMGWGRKHKDETIRFDCFPVSTEFLDVMNMRVVDGRNFIESDSLRSDGVFIFNETAVKTFGIKVGERMEGHSDENHAEVVGVVADFNFQPMQYAIQPICLYIMGSNPWFYPDLAFIRVSGDVALAKEHIKKSLLAVAPQAKDIRVEMMNDSMEYLYEKEDNLAKLITVFSIIAILISIIGVFGIVMFDSRYRRKEIAIRKAHGSSISQILSMFAKYYVYMVVLCFVISVPIVYFAIRLWLENFAYRCEIYWWIFAIALVLIVVITAVTVVVECIKAATENPVKSLKSE